jgi:Recombination endonuclease VII
MVIKCKHSNRKGYAKGLCKYCYNMIYYKESLTRAKSKWAKNNQPHIKEHRKRTKLQLKDYLLKYNYGISLDQYNQLVLKQNNKCPICNQETKLFVDHNHSTGIVRGLICRDCNFALGLLKDSPELFLNAIKYLGG